MAIRRLMRVVGEVVCRLLTAATDRFSSRETHAGIMRIGFCIAELLDRNSSNLCIQQKLGGEVLLKGKQIEAQKPEGSWKYVEHASRVYTSELRCRTRRSRNKKVEKLSKVSILHSRKIKNFSVLDCFVYIGT